MSKKFESKHFVSAFILLSILFWIYIALKKYFVKHCQDKYAFSYNASRMKLGIPIIPSYWHIDQRTPNYILWTGDENFIGHNSKTIAFSDCEILDEYDVYLLHPKNGKKRLIEIKNYNVVTSHKDSVVYTYQIEGYVESIPKKMADSIFTSEHITKDY